MSNKFWNWMLLVQTAALERVIKGDVSIPYFATYCVGMAMTVNEDALEENTPKLSIRAATLVEDVLNLGEKITLARANTATKEGEKTSCCGG